GQSLSEAHEEAQRPRRTTAALAGPCPRTRSEVGTGPVPVPAPLGAEHGAIARLWSGTRAPSEATLRVRVPSPELACLRRIHTSHGSPCGAVPADWLGDPARRSVDRPLDVSP